MDQRLLNKDWRLAHLYFIKNKRGVTIQFKRNRAQREFNKNKHSRNLILKSRQLGFTTEEAVDALDDILFNRNFDALFIAQDLETAKDIFSNKIEFAWRNFPLQRLYGVNAESVRQLKFDFGDNTSSSITVDSSGRGGTFRRLHITEFARVCRMFPDKAREIIEGSIPAVPLNGRADIESTADGEVGDFHDMFWEAWNRDELPKQTEFKAHFFNWTWDDEELGMTQIYTVPAEFQEYRRLHNVSHRDICYYHQKWLSLNKNWDSLRKEYPTTPEEAFAYSGIKLFSPEKIAAMKLLAREGARKGEWIYYDEPIANHRYVVAGDPAEGVGQDSAATVVWDFTPVRPKVVAEYANANIAPDMFAFELKNAGEKYRMALIAVERNNHGFATLTKLKEEYPEEKIYKDEKDRLGWQTNLATKPKMMFDLNTAVNDDLVDIPSKRILIEMQLYDQRELDSAKFDPEATRHFDLLTAAAIGFQMKSYAPPPKSMIVRRPAINTYGRFR